MTEADLARIEAELGLRLPGHYRAFVLDYPPGLREARFEHNQASAAESLLLDDPQLLIDLNKGVREPGRLLVDGESEPGWASTSSSAPTAEATTGASPAAAAARRSGSSSTSRGP